MLPLFLEVVVMKKVLYAVLIVGIIVGLGICSYPFVAGYINEWKNRDSIVQYDNKVDKLDNSVKEELLSKALDYNRVVANPYSLNSNKEATEEILNTYDDILNFDNSLICYISIPSIDVNLPVYHETKENVLSIGAAHMKGTSFPINSGEMGSHSVISAHSGYPSQKFFDDIDELKKGDKFTIKLLDISTTYKVVDINIVKPGDMSKFKVKEGKDLVTLVTCYPFSINTHRLLVTGERVKNEYNKKSTIRNGVDVLFIGCVGALLVGYVAIFTVVRRKSKRV